MTPTPGSARVRLTAEETLAPRRGFVWTAHTRMFGLPVRVRDHYGVAASRAGSVLMIVLGLVTIVRGTPLAERVMEAVHDGHEMHSEVASPSRE